MEGGLAPAGRDANERHPEHGHPDDDRGEEPLVPQQKPTATCSPFPFTVPIFNHVPAEEYQDKSDVDGEQDDNARGPAHASPSIIARPATSHASSGPPEFDRNRDGSEQNQQGERPGLMGCRDHPGILGLRRNPARASVLTPTSTEPFGGLVASLPANRFRGAPDMELAAC